MLATREEEREEEPRSDVFSNIFAGLTFPDAPKNTFIPQQQKNKQEQSSSDINMIELHNNSNSNSHMESFFEEEDFPILPAASSHCSSQQQPHQQQQQQQQQHVMSGISISAVQQPQATLTSQQFDKLYGHTEEVSSPKDDHGQRMYPSLDNMLMSTTEDSQTHYQIRSYSQNPDYCEQEESEEIEEIEEGSEETPFLQQEDCNSGQKQHIQQQPSQQEMKQEESLLRQENERLQKQLQALQASMIKNNRNGTDNRTNTVDNELSSPVVISQVSNINNTVRTAYTATAPTQQSLLQQQPQQQLNVSQIQQRQLQIEQQLQQQRLNQQQVNSSTSNGSATVKYVCCGNCRQWLSSPRDATFVYCPGCGAVNNCDIKPTQATTSQTAPPPSVSRPPARRVGENSPWYLQCVESWF